MDLVPLNFLFSEARLSQANRKERCSMKESLRQERAYRLLYRLGLCEAKKCFATTADAVCICAANPARLEFVTKDLYLDLAKRHGTSWHVVERHLRTACAVAWETAPDLLSVLAGHPLQRRPTPSQFVAILSRQVAYRSKRSRRADLGRQAAQIGQR